MKIEKENWEKTKRRIKAKVKRAEDVDDILVIYFMEMHKTGYPPNLAWIISDYYKSQAYWNPRSGKVYPEEFKWAKSGEKDPLKISKFNEPEHIDEDNPLITVPPFDRLLITLLMKGFTLNDISAMSGLAAETVKARTKRVADILSGRNPGPITLAKVEVAEEEKVKIRHIEKIVEVPIHMEVGEIESIDDYTKRAIEFLVSKGSTWEEIARRLGVTVRCLRDYRKRFKIAAKGS